MGVKPDRLAFGKALWERYTGGKPADLRAIEEAANDPQQAGALTYLERVIDRQLNKCRGILSFDGLLLASVKMWADKLPNNSGMGHSLAVFALGLAAFFLLASSIVMLDLLWVHWGASDDYKTYGREVVASIKVCEHRSRLISCSVVLSVGAVVLLTSLLVIAACSWLPGVVSSLTFAVLGVAAVGMWAWLAGP